MSKWGKLVFKVSRLPSLISCLSAAGRYFVLSTVLLMKLLGTLYFVLCTMTYYHDLDTIRSSTHLTQVSLELRLGTKSQCSPPSSSNCSLYSSPTSTVVSKQSATKAGEKTSTFFTPSLASSLMVSSVYGLIQGSLPNLDWKQVITLSSGSPNFSATNRGVWKHWAR